MAHNRNPLPTDVECAAVRATGKSAASRLSSRRPARDPELKFRSHDSAAQSRRLERASCRRCAVPHPHPLSKAMGAQRAPPWGTGQYDGVTSATRSHDVVSRPASTQPKRHCRCIDILVRENGSFWFEEFRRDMDGGGGWQGKFSQLSSASSELALRDAEQRVAWLERMSVPVAGRRPLPCRTWVLPAT